MCRGIPPTMISSTARPGAAIAGRFSIRWSMHSSSHNVARTRLRMSQRYFDYRLERARRFLWALSTPEPSTPIRYVLFGGDCAMTPASLALEMEGETPVARLRPDAIIHPVPGVPYDG